MSLERVFSFGDLGGFGVYLSRIGNGPWKGCLESVFFFFGGGGGLGGSGRGNGGGGPDGEGPPRMVVMLWGMADFVWGRGMDG